MSFPDKETLTAIRATIKEVGADPAKAEIALVQAFNKGLYTLDTIDSYFIVLQDEKPDLWAKSADPAKVEIDAANAALAVAAYTGKGTAKGIIDARTKHRKAVGAVEADAVARRFGLSSAADFKTIGVAPTGTADDEIKAKEKEKADSTNPWSPNYRGRADEAATEAERIRIIKVLGTKTAASMAASCHVDLAGRLLRHRA
jgi:hypothetical protein